MWQQEVDSLKSQISKIKKSNAGKQKNKNKNFNKFKNVVCFNCGKKGHPFIKCHKPKDMAKIQANKQSYFATKNSSSKPNNSTTEESPKDYTNDLSFIISEVGDPYAEMPASATTNGNATGGQLSSGPSDTMLASHQEIRFSPNELIIDTGATISMTGDSTALHMLDPTSTRPYLGANGVFHTKGCGHLICHISDSLGNTDIKIEAHHNPNIGCTIISASQLTTKGCSFVFGPSGGTMITPDRRRHNLTLKGKLYIWKALLKRKSDCATPSHAIRSGNPYYIDTANQMSFLSTDFDLQQEHVEALPPTAPISIMDIHRKLGCANIPACKHFASAEGITLTDTAIKFCDTCTTKRVKRKGLKMSKDDIDLKPFATAQVDYLGPFEQSYNGHYYVLLFTEYVTGWATIVLTNSTNSAWRHLISYYRQHPELQRFYCDKAINNASSKAACSHHGIELRLITTGSHHRIGQVERCNRTITAMMRSLLAQSNMPHKFWPLAALHAITLYNHTPR
ncbi:MAG: hypothetical protein VXY99_12620, partial [Pseudomonadota bacterium]|nr:hypothetical protein [Pseudomonadota bacterium]